MAFKSQVHKSFKLNGLVLSSDGSSYLSEVLDRIPDTKRDKVLQKLVTTILHQPLDSNRVTKEICETAVRECRTERSDDIQTFHVIDAFKIPRFYCQHETKKFHRVTVDETMETGSMSGRLFPSQAAAKNQMFRERYNLVHQRTLHHSLFSPLTGTGSAGNASQRYRLQPVEYLLGTTGRLKDLIILGMLTQVREGRWGLEDPTGMVPLDFSETSFHQGLFPEGGFVLSEGWYEDKLFHVSAMGLPPAETSIESRERLGPTNYFGGPGDHSCKLSTKLERLFTSEAHEAMFIFLSDVALDSVQVMDKLQLLMSGFADSPPAAFVLCGNFTSDKQQGLAQLDKLKTCLRQLLRLFASFTSLVVTSRLILIPGPLDPGMNRVLPRPALPLEDGFVGKTIGDKAAGSVVLASNPCRLRFYTHEMVVFREDLTSKLYRHCLHIPGEDLPKHLSRTIACQAHLLPLPLHVSPVFWPWDQSLRLYPLPDLVVLADSTTAFTASHAECKVVNPGAFTAAGEYTFKVYYPFSGTVEDSKVNF